MNRTERWQKPAAVYPGDTIGLFAPAGPPDADRLARGIRLIEQLGYQVIQGPGCSRRLRYLAGDDAARANEFTEMLSEPKIKALIAVRGGFGSIRILEHLPQQPPGPVKPVVGYSDITTLHCFLSSQYGWTSLHGPMAAVELAGDFALDMGHSLRHILAGETPLPVHPKNGSRWHVYRHGCVQGYLIGGNLVTLTSLLNTKYFPDLRDTVLVLEEVGEDPYRVDRILMQWSLAGLWQHVKAVIFGEMIRCDPRDAEPSFTIREIISQHAGRMSIPVVSGLPLGHGRRMITFGIGGKVELNTRTGLRFLEPLVRK